MYIKNEENKSHCWENSKMKYMYQNHRKRTLTCSPLLIYHGVGDLRKTHYGSHVSDLMS